MELVTNPKAYGKVFNIGSNEEISIKTLAERVIEKTASKSKIALVPYEEAYPAGFEDMQRRVPSLKRIAALVGFRPNRNLDTILADVADEMSKSLERRSVVNPTSRDRGAAVALGPSRVSTAGRTQTMRIAFVAQPIDRVNPPVQEGSLAIWVYQVARLLARRGHELAIVSNQGSALRSHAFRHERHRLRPCAHGRQSRHQSARSHARRKAGEHPRVRLCLA